MSVDDCTRTLDVREIRGPPFEDIMDALDALGEGERLCLVAGFEPEPLYGVLDAKGFDHEVARGDDAWCVTIEHAR